MHYGVKAKTVALDESRMKAELDEGHPIVVNVGPGDFTDTGHFMIGCEEEFFHVSTPAAGCLALQHSVCLLTGEGASVIQAVRRSTAVQYGYRLYDTFFSVFYHSFPALYAFGYEFQRNVFVGGVQIIGFPLIDKAAYHVVGRCKRCYLTHPVGDVYGAYVGEPGDRKSVV